MFQNDAQMNKNNNMNQNQRKNWKNEDQIIFGEK